jgi:hypothetical protein
MRNIKDRGLLAGVKMRSQNTHARVLYRHSIASKRNHFTTMLHVKVIESSSLGRLKEGGRGVQKASRVKMFRIGASLRLNFLKNLPLQQTQMSALPSSAWQAS